MWPKSVPILVESKVVDRFIDGLAGSGSGLGLRRYEKGYREYIIHRHRNFDVKRLNTQGPYTLQLATVFVELSTAPRPLHTTGGNPISLPERLQRGGHTVWEYLKAGENNQQNFAIIGPPGSGKTALSISLLSMCAPAILNLPGWRDSSALRQWPLR